MVLRSTFNNWRAVCVTMLNKNGGNNLQGSDITSPTWIRYFGDFFRIAAWCITIHKKHHLGEYLPWNFFRHFMHIQGNWRKLLSRLWFFKHFGCSPQNPWGNDMK